MFGAVLNRLATSVRRALSQYAVGGNEPELALNFIDNEYITNNSTSTFASAVTHARAGNATMTDGYGPELVTNGGFDSDSDWTLGTGWSIQNNRAYHASGANSNITQTIAVEAGKAYILEFYLSEGSSSNLWFIVDGAVTSVDSPTTRGNRSFVFTHDTTETIAVGVRAGSTNVTSIDNVSVREMPVIKWAPHNLLTYSEDLTQWTENGATASATVLTSNSGINAHARYTTFDYTANQKQTFSGRIEAGTHSYVNVNIYANTSKWIAVVFDLTTGTVSETATGVTSGTIDSSEISDNGDGSYTYKIVGSIDQTTSTARFYIGFAESATGNTFDTAAGRSMWQSLATGTETFTSHYATTFRSDLGGMVDNPDRGDSYVPTTSAAVFLPRVGHHVFNSNAWVNEGVLAESESRTNLITDSFDFSAWANVGTTVTSDDAVSPAGTESADAILETTATSEHYRQKSVLSLTGTYTFSVYLKAAGSTQYVILGERSTTGAQASFDLTNGAVENTSLATATIQNIGNGWYRCSLTPFSSLSNQTFGSRIQLDNNGVIDANSYAGNASNGVYAYGAQLEEGSTPSSLIPTSGSTVSRAAESFTIPSANLPWPTPQYIGSELVTNGDFSIDSDWTKGTGWTISGGVASRGAQSGSTACDQAISLVAGKVYSVTYTINSLSGGNFQTRFLGGTQQQGTTRTSAGTYEDIFVALSGNNTVRLVATAAGTVVEVDNVSVREINPLAVCIGMEGRMTYADDDSAAQYLFSNWELNSTNRIQLRLNTSIGTGGITFLQRESGTTSFVDSSSVYSPDILVPYNIASRHGSTFVNGAVDGVALTANTTPTALPDLSSTDLTLAYDYMGTISEFRVWDKDITDDGLEEATNPSPEPSLSLEFSGTGTNSFVVNNWSE